MKISALIPYKPDNGRRDYLWSHVQKRYFRFLPEIEICLGIDDTEPFCRAKAINRAATQAIGDVFILVDSDVIFDPVLIRKIMYIINFHPWIIPFQKGYRLTHAATERLIGEGLPEKIKIENKDYERIEIYPGTLMNIMTRHCFETIKGLDELFCGYGYEDFAMREALNTLCGHYYQMNEEIYHLWHPPFGSALKPNIDRWSLYEAASGNVENIQMLINERFNHT